MILVLMILYVLVCLFLVLVVLLQQGKGADLAGAFGGGGSQASFGPRSSTNIMHRLTSWSFVLFVLLSLAIAVLSGKERQSVVEDLPAATAAEETAQPQMGPETADETAPAVGTEIEPAPAADEPVEQTGTAPTADQAEPRTE